MPGPGNVDESLGLFGSVKGRVGMEMGGILPYLTAGVTASQLKTNAIGYAERNGTAVGGIVGARVDVPLTHNFGKKTFELRRRLRAPAHRTDA